MLDVFGKVFGGLGQMAGTSTIRLVIIAGIVSAIIGFVTWGYLEIKQAGVNECRVSTQEAVQAAVSNATDGLYKRLAELEKDRDRQKQAAQDLQTQLSEARKRQQDLTNEIIKTEFACVGLGADWLRIYNQQIGEQPGI